MNTPTRIDQVIPSIVEKDAVSNHTFTIQRVLHEMGFESEIYVDVIGPGCETRVQELPELEKFNDEKRLLIYQYSIGSRAANYFMAAKGKKIVDYHNIAPSHFFTRWLPSLAAESVLGRSQMLPLSKVSFAAVADSGYNAEELTQNGFKNVDVLPIMIDPGNLSAAPRPGLLNALSEQEGTKWLFVGQLAPHKAQHNLIKAFYCYLKAYDTQAHLYIVGREMGPLYKAALVQFVDQIGISDSVTFTGGVTSEELVAYYKGCDVFASMSEHEGFCVPLIEAMHHEIPVVAYGQAAVPETIGEAGVVLSNNDPYETAAAVHILLEDKKLREELVASGKEKAAQFEIARTEEKFKEVVKDLIETF
ncbi:MAG: glycosyltransferase [Firmicutes bacterium]|nr:glycosyltransferase [Bacillota bacterium]